MVVNFEGAVFCWRKWEMHKVLAFFSAVMAATLVGCGTSGESQYPLSGLQEYETPDEMAADLNAGGFDCEGYERTSGFVNAASSGECWHPRSGDEDLQTILMIFNTEADQRNQVEIYREMAELLSDMETGFVEGGNWMVNCGDHTSCAEVQEILGGRKEISPLI